MVTANRSPGHHTTFPTTLPSFSSELLLQQAIAGLLSRMPDIREIQILQGAQETGKDIVFTTKGAFDEILPCACVVKNHRITGQVGSARAARTVFQQVQQALDTPYPDGAGQEIWAQRVYVISPFPLAVSTLNSIKGALHKDAGRVIFVGGHELFQLFRVYWPNFFADEASFLERYLSEMSDELSINQPLAQIADLYDLSEAGALLTHIYVPLSFHRDLGEYNDTKNIYELIPASEELKQLWTVSFIKQSKANLRVLRSVVSHLDLWGYRESPGFGSELTDVMNAIDHFSEALESSFIKGAKEKIGVFRISLKQIPENAKFTLADIPILKQEIKSLENSIARAFQPFLNELENSSRYINRLRAGDLEWLSILSDHNFVKAGQLCDCIYDGLSNLIRPSSHFKVSFPATLLDDSHVSLLIVGSPGSGKTTFCRWNALADTEKFRVDNAKRIPVYVPLNRLARRNIIDFKSVIEGSATYSALRGDVSKQIFNQKGFSVRLYLDGLDEIPDDAQRKKVIDAVRDFVSQDKRFQVVITTRDIVYGPYLSWLPRISISDLNQEQLNTLINRWLGKNITSISSLLSQLNSVSSLKEVVRNPLLATLTILLFRRTQRLPANKVRLYAAFTELLAGGWDLAKGILRESHFGRDVKLMVLGELAAHIHSERQRDFNGSTLKVVAKRVFSDISKVDVSALEKELLVDGLIQRSGHLLQFSHLSFQEYLAARMFMGSPRRVHINRALRQFLNGDDWWLEVIKFYMALSGSPKELINWLDKQADTMRISANDLRFVLLRSALAESYPEYNLA